MLYINVPENDFSQVKILGAQWDSNKKMWYVPNINDYSKFGKWILTGQEEVSILHEYFYIVIADKTCPYCGKRTNVIAFCSNNHLSFYNDSLYVCDLEAEEMTLVPYESLPFTDGIYRLLNKRFNFDFEYSVEKNRRNYFNRCLKCNSKITNLKSDTIPGISVFNLFSIKNVKTLRLYKVSLPYDLNLQKVLKVSESELLGGIFPGCKSFKRLNEKSLNKLYEDLDVIQDSFSVAGELNPSKRDIFANLSFNPPLVRVVCPDCGGELKIRKSKYGYFTGCSNYPDCRTTKKLTELIYMYFKQNGFKIYKWQRKCWKCSEIATVYSYYPLYELGLAYDYFDNYSGMGLSDIPSLDTYLSQTYATIKRSYSKTVGESYMANHCQHCGSIQGYNYVVTDPHGIHNELNVEYRMDEHLDRYIPFDLVNPSQKEITDGFEWIEENSE